MKKFFTKEEAEGKVGKEVVAKKSFLDIPAGTVGQVTTATLTPSGPCVMILWKDREEEMAVSKDRYEESIEEKSAASVDLVYDKESGFTIDSGK